MYLFKNNRIYSVFCLASVIFLASCSSSNSLKYEKGNSEHTYKRLKKGNYELPTDTEYIELSASTSRATSTDKPMSKKPEAKRSPKSVKNITQLTEEELVRENIFTTAYQYHGIPYKFTGKSPNTGFDCSGFVNYVYKSVLGITIDGSSSLMAKHGELRPDHELKKGDLLFFGRKGGRIHHVGIVASNENGEIEMIHSASGEGISIINIRQSDYWRNKFFFGKDVITGYLKQRQPEVSPDSIE